MITQNDKDQYRVPDSRLMLKLGDEILGGQVQGNLAENLSIKEFKE